MVNVQSGVLVLLKHVHFPNVSHVMIVIKSNQKKEYNDQEIEIVFSGCKGFESKIKIDSKKQNAAFAKNLMFVVLTILQECKMLTLNKFIQVALK